MERASNSSSLRSEEDRMRSGLATLTPSRWGRWSLGSHVPTVSHFSSIVGFVAPQSVAQYNGSQQEARPEDDHFPAAILDRNE